MIKYLKHSEIDKLKWDKCITESINALIYAYSWYLDITCPGWDALVEDDYDSVMPLPQKTKMGINYIYVPHFTQQLGLFTKKTDSNTLTFINEIPKKFKLIEIKLNTKNTISDKLVNNKKNINQLLNIGLNYIDIRKNYTRNCIRNLKKANDAGFIINNNITPKKFSGFILQNLKGQIEELSAADIDKLEKLTQKVLHLGKGELVSLTDIDNNIHAAGFYIFDNARLIFSVCASTTYGKDNQAMYLLVDTQVKKHCKKFRLYDFSGSNQEGISYFNSTFGAYKEIYETIKINRLPFLLKLLKK